MPHYTFAEQWKLYQKYVAHKGAVAVVPGTKHHGTFNNLVCVLESEHTNNVGKNYGKGLTGANPLQPVEEIKTVNPQTQFWDTMTSSQIIADIQKYKKLIEDQYIQPKYVEPEPWHFEYEGVWIDEPTAIEETEKSEAPISAEEYLKRMMQ